MHCGDTLISEDLSKCYQYSTAQYAVDGRARRALRANYNHKFLIISISGYIVAIARDSQFAEIWRELQYCLLERILQII